MFQVQDSTSPILGSNVNSQTVPSGYLSTSGASIVDDATGAPVSLVGANWFGAEGNSLIPNGLWARNYQEMMDEMANEGLNVLRIPISPALITDTVVTSGFRSDLNPDLVGKTPLEIMDAIIDYAGQIGIKVILDMHRITPGVGKQEDGLWFNDTYSLEDLGADWQTIAGRYAGNETVVGVDLFNEPSGAARWGDEAPDPSLDWAAAATYLGNAVHEVNPDLLVLVEGIHIVDNKWYWVGGNLKGVADQPIALDQPNKLVYSPHDYPSSVVDVPWLKDATAADMVEGFRDHWGFIVENGIAPVLLGETGAHMDDAKDTIYMDALFNYLDQLSEAASGSANVTWWGWNPNSGDTGGLLANDWRTVHEDKLAYLDRLDAEISREGGHSIEVVMDANLHQDRVFHYTVSGTKDGELVDLKDGVLHFAKGDADTAIELQNNLVDDVTHLNLQIFWIDGRPAGSFDVDVTTVTREPSEDAVQSFFSATLSATTDSADVAEPEELSPGLSWNMPEYGQGSTVSQTAAGATSGKIQVEFEIIQSWGNNFFARAYVTNTSEHDIEDWNLEIVAEDFDLLEIHSADFEINATGSVQVDAPDWNATLSAGETAQFGIDGVLFDMG